MKKKIILILVLLFGFIPKIYGLDKSFVDWQLDKSVVVHQKTSKGESIRNLAMITANGTIAYCIEPGVMADKASMYDTTFNINDTNMKNVDVKKLSRIGYYGYGYDGHNTKEYYMATQELIWRQQGVIDVWWTDNYGNIINIDSYKNEIDSLASKYEVLPRFNFRKEYIVGDNITLTDQNKVLEDFDVTSLNNNVSIEGNSLKIKVIEGDNKFTLSRKNNGKMTKFYYKTGYQTIGSFEAAYPLSKTYDINYTYGKIIIDKYDYDTKSKTPSSKDAALEGAKYGLFDKKGNLIKEGITNKNGNIVFDKLSYGTYKIKEIEPSYGYALENVVVETYLDSGRLEYVFKSYEPIIKNKIVIVKVFEDDDKTIPEKDIMFHIYDEYGKLYKEVVTNEDGIIEIMLPFGNYLLKQVTSPQGITKVEDTIISVTKNNKMQRMVLINKRIPEEKKEEPKEKEPPKEEIIKELPKTGKNTFFTIILVTNSLSIIGLLNEKESTKRNSNNN